MYFPTSCYCLWNLLVICLFSKLWMIFLQIWILNLQCSNNFPTTLSIMYLSRFLSYLHVYLDSTVIGHLRVSICFPVKRWISIWRHNLFLSEKWRTNISKVPEEWSWFQFRKQNKRQVWYSTVQDGQKITKIFWVNTKR